MPGRRTALSLILLSLSLAINAAGQDDRSNLDPTEWFWFNSADQAFTATRFTDINVESTNPLRFSTLAVRSQGSYDKGWWWYYGMDEASLRAKIQQDNARIIDLDVYTIDGQRRVAAVLVSNTGADAKSWWWEYDQPIDTIVSRAQQRGARLTMLKSYAAGSSRLFSALMIANTGADARGWWYGYSVNSAWIQNLINSTQSRLISIHAIGADLFDVVTEESRGQVWWWYTGRTQNELQILAGDNRARIIDISPYDVNGRRLYAAIMLKSVIQYPTLLANPTSLRFVRHEDEPLPPEATISLTSTGAPIPFAVSYSNETARWASIQAPVSTTPATVRVSVYGGFAGSSFTGDITIQAGASGTIVINTTYNVLPPCGFDLTSSTTNFAIAGGTGSVDLRTLSDCRWTAMSTVPWITLGAPASGTGPGRINFTVGQNTGAARTGAITINGRASITISQASIPPPSLDPQPVVSLGSLAPGSAVSPGSLVRIKGVSLASQLTHAFSAAVRLSGPLGGVSAIISGLSSGLQLSAGVLEVAPDHVDIQLPWGIQNDSPDLTLVGPNYRLTTRLSLAVTSPDVLQVTDSGVRRPAVYRAPSGSSTFTLVTSANPLQPGDRLMTRVTGLGPVSRPPTNGEFPPFGSSLLYPVGVVLGGVSCEVQSAALISSGGADNIGVASVVATVPPEVPFGNGVQLVLQTGARQSNPVAVAVTGRPASISLGLRQPDVMTAPPFESISLPASGLIPAAPAAVRFFSADGSYSQTVGTFDVTPNGLTTFVPPYFDAGRQQYASGTVSIEILQSINGQAVRSNAIDGFVIPDLPPATLPAGTVSVAMLRAQAETFRASAGTLGYTERLSKGQRATSGARALLENGASSATATANALAGIVADPTSSIPVADVGNGVVSLDAETLGLTDRILTAVIRSGLPAPPAPATPAQRQSSRAGILFLSPGDPRSASPPLPDCEIPEPSERELVALANGTRSATSYVQQYKACLESLNRLTAINDFSDWLARKTARYDRMLKKMATFVFSSEVEVLSSRQTPVPDKVRLAKFLSALFSMPTYVNLAGQTLAGAVTLGVTVLDGSPQARQLEENVSRNLEKAIYDFGKDRFYDKAGEWVGNRTFGPPPTPGAQLLGNNTQAVIDTLSGNAEAQGRVVETENGVDPKGAAGQNLEDTPSYPPATTIEGVATDGSGTPQSQGSVELCPPLPGQSNPPLSQSPTYGDGSYVLVMPINFDEPDKVCKVILKTPGQPDQSVFTDISQPPSRIDFPDAAISKDELLYGQALGSGDLSGCGTIGGIGLTKMRVLLLNTSLNNLARSGGLASGMTTYTGVSAGFQPGNCKPEYVSEIKNDVPVTLEVAAGGAGVLRIADDRDYQVQVTPSGITGATTPPTCGVGVNCKFNLELARFK